MPKITFITDFEVDAKIKQTVLGASLAANIPHVHACGGNARCSTCRVLIIEGVENCSPRNDAERAVSERLSWPEEIRLACQTRILGDVVLRRMTIDETDQKLAEAQMEHGTSHAIGREQHIVAMFTDVRNYTPFVEKFLPYDVLHVLRRLFAQMSERVAAYGGLVNNYMGDGMVALFGLEEGRENPELDAVRAGLAMLDDVHALQGYFQELYGREIIIGVGIDAGSAVLGNLGTGDNEQFTAIGAPMNKASRIESATKLCATNLVVSDTVYDQVAKYIRPGETHQMELKGVPGLSTLVEIEGLL